MIAFFVTFWGGRDIYDAFCVFYEFSPAKSEYATYFNESVSTYSSS